MLDTALTSLKQFVNVTLTTVVCSDLHPSELLEKFLKPASIFLSFTVLYVFYEYIEYLVIVDSCNYEESTKKRCNFMRRMAQRLEQLSAEYGDFYFYYLPMDHGLNIPPTYALFQAIKEVLNKNNKPASRRICVSILTELAQLDYESGSGKPFGDEEQVLRKVGFGDCDHSALDPLSDFNLNIMQFTREMVVFGVKDIEIMVALHHLTEAIFQDS